MSQQKKTDEVYAQYKLDPSPQNLNSVVSSLKPTVDYQLASLGSSTDPVMRNKALTYTAKAVKDFDPEISSLPTYVSSQLRRLSRDRRAVLSPVKVPERIQLEAYSLYKKEQEFIDKEGREPDLGELAEFADTDIKKINTLRNAMRPVVTEETFGDFSENSRPDYLAEATDYVYNDSDHIDRKILEYKTGYGKSSAATSLKAIDIAAKLKISPSQVSRRSLRLSKKINELKEALES
jgi:DNA-directed RNA polymerase specialized sigma subunit